MASENSLGGPNVPGFRKQAKTVAASVLEREKREKLTAEVTRFATELAGLTKEHVTDAEKRSALLRYARGLPRQAVATAKDPAARAHLLDKLKVTMTTVQQAIKDPTKRQELHDSLAATTHNLMTSSGLVSSVPPSAGLVSPDLVEPGLASDGLASLGLQSSGLNPPDLASPGLESPNLASPAVESPGLNPPALAPPGPESADLASPDLASSGVGSPGLESPDPASLGLASPSQESADLASLGAKSASLAPPGPQLPDLASPGSEFAGLASPGPALSGLASPGPEAPDLASPSLVPPGLAPPGPESTDLASPGLALPGASSSGQVSPHLLSPGTASSGLASPDLGPASLGPTFLDPVSAGPVSSAPGLVTPGLGSPGPAGLGPESSGLALPDVGSSGPASPGLGSVGPASTGRASLDSATAGPVSSASGLVTSGLASPRPLDSSVLASPGLGSAGLAPARRASLDSATVASGLVTPGLVTPGRTSLDLASPAPAPSALTPPALASAGLALSRLASPRSTSTGLASPGLTPPATPNAFEGAASIPGIVPMSPTAGQVRSSRAAAWLSASPAAGRMPSFPPSRRIPSPPTPRQVPASPTVGMVSSPPKAGFASSPPTPRQRGQPFLACSHMQRLPSQQQQQQQQQPPAKKQACKVFISHARERKSIVASSLHTMLTQAAGISTYLDERGLIPGTPNATAMEFELHNAPVVVLLLTKEYMCKKWPMWELDIALKRRSTPSSPVKVIPVLVDISIAERSDLSNQLYHHKSWIQSNGCNKPTEEDLQHWAALGREVTRLACLSKDQGPSTGSESSSWVGDLSQLIMGECVAALKLMKLLPPDYTLRDPRRLPMFVSKPDNVIVGRVNELESVHRGLLQQKRLVVIGGPGEGKTALARSVTRQLYNEGCFPAGAFEVDMTAVAGDEREAVASLLVPYLKQALGNPIAADDPPNWKTLERWLQMNHQPWMLLLDNVEELIKHYKSPTTAQSVLDNLVTSLFGASRGALHLIIVSRTTTPTLTQAAVCQLQHLPEGGAAALLRSHCPNVTLTDAQAADVTKACGCNPLELQLIGGLLNRNCVTPKAVVAKGRAARLLADTMVGDPATERLVQWWKQLLGPALEEAPSWNLFSKRRQPLLAVAALATFAGSFSASSAATVAGAVCCHPVALTDLRDLGVLQNASRANGLGDRYEMHHYHRQAAEQLLREAPDQQQAAVHAFIGCTLQLAQQLQSLHKQATTTDGGRVTGLNSLRKLEAWSCLAVAEAANITHMLALLEQLTTLSPPDHSITPEWQQQVASDLVDLGWELYNIAQYHLAEQVYRRALAMREAVLGPKHPYTASTLSNLAGLLKAQGKLAEAEPLYRRNLAINEEVLGSEHRDTARSLNNLAELLQDQGKLTEAELMYRRALALREEVLGPEHPETASTLNNLAGLLQDEGKLAEAEPLCKRALVMCEENEGPEHPRTACSLNNLALLLEAQGKLAEAEPLYKRALAINEVALGSKHPHTAISVNNVAIVLWAQGKLAEAKPLCKRALAIREEVLGPNHPDTITTRSNLTRLMQNRGMLAR